MIQDRLTAKFQPAKPAKRSEPTAQRPAPAKPVTAPAADGYTKGRTLSGSFWL